MPNMLVLTMNSIDGSKGEKLYNVHVAESSMLDALKEPGSSLHKPSRPSISKKQYHFLISLLDMRLHLLPIRALSFFPTFMESSNIIDYQSIKSLVKIYMSAQSASATMRFVVLVDGIIASRFNIEKHDMSPCAVAN